MKTKLGIQYELEVLKFENFNTTSVIDVTATCENGSEEFSLFFDNKHGIITDEELNNFMDDADLTEIESWVNKTETEYFVKWFNDYCVENSSSNSFYSVSFSYFEWFSLTLYKSQPIDNGTGIRDFKSVEFYQAVGVDEMNDLILKLKNK